MMDHERIEELMAARALGGLDPSDGDTLRQEMAVHGSECEDCRRIESEFAEVAGRLAFALDPVPVREGFEDEVVAAAAGRRVTAAGERVTRMRTTEAGMDERKTSPRSRGLRPLVAVAASILLFASGLTVGAFTSDDSAALEGARVVALQGEGEGSLAVAFRPGETGVYVLGSDLQTLPAGSVYEAWIIRGGRPARATCFRPSDGSVVEFVDADLADADAMAVTVEASTCPSAPTTEPIFAADVTA